MAPEKSKLLARYYPLQQNGLNECGLWYRITCDEKQQQLMPVSKTHHLCGRRTQVNPSPQLYHTYAWRFRLRQLTSACEVCCWLINAFATGKLQNAIYEIHKTGFAWGRHSTQILYIYCKKLPSLRWRRAKSTYKQWKILRRLLGTFQPQKSQQNQKIQLDFIKYFIPSPDTSRMLAFTRKCCICHGTI